VALFPIPVCNLNTCFTSSQDINYKYLNIEVRIMDVAGSPVSSVT
jgi:hypothetical protein